MLVVCKNNNKKGKQKGWVQLLAAAILPCSPLITPAHTVFPQDTCFFWPTGQRRAGAERSLCSAALELAATTAALTTQPHRGSSQQMILPGSAGMCLSATDGTSYPDHATGRAAPFSWVLHPGCPPSTKSSSPLGCRWSRMWGEGSRVSAVAPGLAQPLAGRGRLRHRSLPAPEDGDATAWPRPGLGLLLRHARLYTEHRACR